MRSRLWLVAVLLAGAVPQVFGATAACAGTGERAALVVDTGQNTFSYCVSLPDDSVSGLELIELANDQHGLQYRFGDGGQAVCMLANVGAEGDDCFGKYPDFWGFWRGDGNGGWTWSSVGAGSTLVRDGDVQGWSWGSGQDGSTHPKPPPTRFDDVCKPAPVRTEEDPGQEPKQGSESSSSSATSDGGGDGTGSRNVPTRGQRKALGRTEEPPQESGVSEKRRTTRTATAPGRAPGAAATAPGAPTGAVTATDSTPAEGPPIAGLAAVAVVAVLGAGGTIAMRRRRV